MDQINSYITSLEDPLDKLIYDDPQEYINNYKKINIYNSGISKPFQKIWFVTDKLKMNSRIYFSNKQKHSALMSLVIYDETGNNSLKKFINRLEKKISEIVSATKKKKKLKSVIKKDSKFYPILNLQLPYSENNGNIKFKFNIFNENNQDISYKDIENGSYIKSYIEVSEIWISPTEFGMNLKVLQMKVYPEFDFSNKCLFDDYPFIDNKNTVEKSFPLPPPPPFLPKLKEKINKEDPKKKFIPTVNDLLSVKLRPIQDSHEKIIDVKEITKDDEQDVENKEEIVIEKKEINKPIKKKKKKNKKSIKN